jgi:hypothetical protein
MNHLRSKRFKRLDKRERCVSNAFGV